MKLRLTEKPTIDQREGQVVVIFPKRPYWFSATEEVIEVLEILEQEIEEAALFRNLGRRWHMTTVDVREELQEIIELLIENGVLFVDGIVHLAETQTVAPAHQVSEVESVLVIATTQACNLICPHCYANAKQSLPNELTTDEVKHIIDQVAAMSWERSITNIALTGGEIFLRLDAIELIQYVSSLGFHVLVNTNAVLLDDALIAKLVTVPRLKLSISLDGPNASIHEFIRGNGTFEPTVLAIRSLVAAGISVGANMFVHGGNLLQVGATLELARQLGMNAFNCLPLMRVGRANSKRSQRLLQRVSEVDLYQTLFKLLRDRSDYRQLMRRSTFANQVMGIAAGVKSYTCGVGTNRALYVMSDGNLYPCPDTALRPFLLGNLRNDRLNDVWNTSKCLETLRKLNVDTLNPVCAACDVRYLCGGNCRGENYQVTGDLYAPHYNCKEIRDSILEIMWMLTEEPAFFQSEVEHLYSKVC